MKRDWDLIRKQLTDIEEEKNILADIPDEPKQTDQSWEEYEKKLEEYRAIENRILGHLELLAENRYIEGVHIVRSLDGLLTVGVSSPRLTMAGHDLLDTIRSSTVWESVKETAKKKGIELTFDAIKLLAATALRHMIG